MKSLRIINFFLGSILVLFSCSEEESSNGRSVFSDKYEDGIYCADVSYYNPNTGNSNTYTLNVEIENNELIKIYWPNGGWLDDSHFIPEELDYNGFCSFSSDKGYEYTVQITGSECSFDDGDQVESDAEIEKTAVTCPKCRNEKETYKRYCDDCIDEIENTCRSCGGFEYNVNGGLCYSCKREENEDEEE